LKAGRVLVGVRAGDRTNEAWDILHLCGGYDLAHQGLEQAGPTTAP
jgi:hypothetical protein